MDKLFEELIDRPFGEVTQDKAYTTDEICAVLTHARQLERDTEALRVLNYMKDWLKKWSSSGKKTTQVKKTIALSNKIGMGKKKLKETDDEFFEEMITEKLDAWEKDLKKLVEKYKKQFPKSNLDKAIRKVNVNPASCLTHKRLN